MHAIRVLNCVYERTSVHEWEREKNEIHKKQALAVSIRSTVEPYKLLPVLVTKIDGWYWNDG